MKAASNQYTGPVTVTGAGYPVRCTVALMQRLSDLSPSIIWVFLFFTLSLSSATRQFIWLMALVGLIVFARGPREFLSTDGVRKFWIVLGCFLLPAVF